jgi:hypothetical protein
MNTFLVSYWVCEKSDGIRILFLICTNLQTDDQMVFIVGLSVNGSLSYIADFFGSGDKD